MAIGRNGKEVVRKAQATKGYCRACGKIIEAGTYYVAGVSGTNSQAAGIGHASCYGLRKPKSPTADQRERRLKD